MSDTEETLEQLLANSALIIQRLQELTEELAKTQDIVIKTVKGQTVDE